VGIIVIVGLGGSDQDGMVSFRRLAVHSRRWECSYLRYIWSSEGDCQVSYWIGKLGVKNVRYFTVFHGSVIDLCCCVFVGDEGEGL
jgi:hypothetical protein